MKNLKELINLAFAKRSNEKPKGNYRSTQSEFEPGYNPMTGRTDLNVNALAKKVRETKFTKKYDDNPALKGGQKNLPDALQNGIINKAQNEHHLKNNPDAKYVATAAPNGWFDVWEGETFDITGENGVLVGKFKTMKDLVSQSEIVDDKIRLTSLGLFLRKYSLDELPQFINLFIGDMNIIGPRPNIIDLVKEYLKIEYS